MEKPVLYDYFRSSAGYRVRIALGLKGIEYHRVDINLLQSEQKEEAYRQHNPQGLVPTLEVDGHRLTQSLAIIDYLEAAHPIPRLLPIDAAERAHVLALALIVTCDIHPVNNLRVLKYLSGPLGQDEESRNAWYAHWVRDGLAAMETLAAPRAGRFLVGDHPTLADVCVVPQLFNARRFGVPIEDFPTLLAADEEANRLDAFAAAHPDVVGQPK